MVGNWWSGPCYGALAVSAAAGITSMNPELATELIKMMIMQAITLASPILLTALTIGLMVSLFQAVTSIHEQTLSFVPKALGIIGLILTTLPWMLRTSMEYTTAIIEKIPQMVR
jgi:flagellar biosynthetic protein FliQ